MSDPRELMPPPPPLPPGKQERTLSLLMCVVGIFLLVPGLCSLGWLSFWTTMDLGLILLCVVATAIGAALIVTALRMLSSNR